MFEFLYIVLLAGGFWFWSVLVVLNIAFLIALENKKGIGFTLMMLAVTVATLGYINPECHPMTWIWEHPGTTFLYILGYLLIGTFWSIAKWWFFVSDQRAKYDTLKEKFIAERNIEIDINQPIPAGHQTAWKNKVDRAYGLEVPPSAKRHRPEICLWIAYWPWSVFWTLASDFVIRLLHKIYDTIAGILHYITKRGFRGTADDFSHHE